MHRDVRRFPGRPQLDDSQTVPYGSFQKPILRALWEKNRSDPSSKMGSRAKGRPNPSRLMKRLNTMTRTEKS